MKRRTFVRTAGIGAAGFAAGCLTRDDGNGDGGDDGTLTIATYQSMTDSEDPAGPWLEENFDPDGSDVTIDWLTPESGVNHYIQRVNQDATIDADLFLGVNVDDLVRVDGNVDDGAGPLFREFDRGEIERADRVRDDLAVDDPDSRVIPYDTGYISLVYDEGAIEAPTSFDDLIADEYAGTLLAQNAQTSDPGQAFLLWTIDAYGSDSYLDYWRDLVDNDVRILGDWNESYYGAYAEGERPMVVSYSTDQVFANRSGEEMTRHQVAFLEDQGYANVETMAVFEDASNPDLAYEFADFVLSNEAQAEIAVRNVQFPAVADEHVDLDEEFDEYAHRPPETVTMGYEDLRGNLDGWLEDWGREIAGQ